MAVGNVLISVCRDAHERPCKFIADLGASCAFCVCLPVRGCLSVSLSSNVAPLLAYPGAYSCPSLCSFHVLIPPFSGSRRVEQYILLQGPVDIAKMECVCVMSETLVSIPPPGLWVRALLCICFSLRE